ncbi:MAG: CocE/NonD family hydrolase [Betaproteobacteria bacterium]
MQIDWDVPITMDDGAVVRADIFRPADGAQHAVILAYGPYAKGLNFAEGYADPWNIMLKSHPEVAANSSNRYQAWEVVDPERWVPDGYICIRIDARGWGRSPGYVEPWGPREAQDMHACIEWAGTQAWSNGKVGLLGISYYAINQWHAAGLQPPHLAAMIPWEGFADFYRDFAYHGGIGCDMKDVWYRRTTTTVQHGLGTRALTNRNTGELVAGPDTLSDAELAHNRSDFPGEINAHPLDDAFHRARSAQWDKVVVPFLSSGNWGGSSLHLRGNTEGFLRAASTQKWLEIHGREHWTEFYTDYGIALQKRFFDHFLKGLDNGWDRQPPVLLRVRTVDDSFIDRHENEWPIARTQWTRYYLDTAGNTVATTVPATGGSAVFKALESEGITFSTPPLVRDTEITGPAAVKLFVSSDTADADLFVVLRVFRPDGSEVVFKGAVDPHTPVGHGWLRASHRKLDPALSTAWRPYHTHDEIQPLTPGAVYELDIEIWPTSVIVPAGHRIALTVRGKDYEYAGEIAELDFFKNSKLKGVGIYTHTNAQLRPPALYGGSTTLHCGGVHAACVVLPVIPAR